MPKLFPSADDPSLPLSLITITLSFMAMMAISVAYGFVLYGGDKDGMRASARDVQISRLISKLQDNGFQI